MKWMAGVLPILLPDGYIPIGCFVTPHVLLEMVARHLYGDLHATIADETKISAAGLTTFDYWAGQDKRRETSQTYIFFRFLAIQKIIFFFTQHQSSNLFFLLIYY